MTNILGYIGETILMFALIPQIYKIYKTKEAKTLSYIWMLIVIIGLVFRLTYLLNNNSGAVLLGSSVQLVMFIVMFCLKYKYEKTNL